MPSSHSVWIFQPTYGSATTWATKRCACQTYWTTRPCLRSSSRRVAGCPFWQSDATLTRRCSSALFLLQCAWTGPSTPAGLCVRRCGTAALRSWRPTAFPGRRCCSARSFPSTTICAFLCSSPQVTQLRLQVGPKRTLYYWFRCYWFIQRKAEINLHRGHFISRILFF